MKKIQNFFFIYAASSVILCLLLITTIFYHVQSDRIKNLTLQSLEVLTTWKELENKTNDILLNRYTHFGKKDSPVISEWEQLYKGFGKELEQLIAEELVQKQPEIQERLQGAYRVWRFTEVRLNNARYYFSQIIQSGLGQKVMVNGLLHTMYQMRIEGKLKVEEIFLLEDTIYALESLDNAADEFDTLFKGIVFDMQNAGEVYLKRVKYLYFAFFGSVIFLLVISYIINHQLTAAQENRKLLLESRKSSLLRAICEQSSQELVHTFYEQQQELQIEINMKEPLFLTLLQIDDYANFSHIYNEKEQQAGISAVLKDFTAFLAKQSLPSEHFLFQYNIIVCIVNSSKQSDIKEICGKISAWHSTIGNRFSLTVSVTVSDFCYEAEDLDQDFEHCLKLSEYRYLLGKNSFITEGSWITHPEETFRYPSDKERQFAEAFKTLDADNTIKIMQEMISYALPFGPESVKRLIIRLTAAQSSVVELLERLFSIPAIKDVTPMILQIQTFETFREAEQLLKDVAQSVILA